MKGLIFYDVSPPIRAVFYPPFHILQQWPPSVTTHMLEEKKASSLIRGLIQSVNYSHLNDEQFYMSE